jgi:hypothetical protein
MEEIHPERYATSDDTDAFEISSATDNFPAIHDKSLFFY